MEGELLRLVRPIGFTRGLVSMLGGEKAPLMGEARVLTLGEVLERPNAEDCERARAVTMRVCPNFMLVVLEMGQWGGIGARGGERGSDGERKKIWV
jgi:hypothetical protein